MHERNGNNFQHRSNRDGTHDSICTTCNFTVASMRQEFELARYEDIHLCDLVQLYHAGQFARRAPRDLDRSAVEPEHRGPAAT